jgi:predicted transcriptional regulator
VPPAQQLRRLALVVHPTRPIDVPLAALNAWASARGIDVVQATMDGDAGRSVAPASRLTAHDLVVAIGGDGTVLWALRASIEHRAPVLGVACGSLGALSLVSADDLHDALDRVWAGDWIPRPLPVLRIAGDTGAEAWAANDFVVLRRGGGQLVAELAVDGERYVRMAGDGLVVATPLGSSAYTMAVGGPVLAAGTEAFACTPIAMHGGSAARRARQLARDDHRLPHPRRLRRRAGRSAPSAGGPGLRALAAARPPDPRHLRRRGPRAGRPASPRAHHRQPARAGARPTVTLCRMMYVSYIMRRTQIYLDDPQDRALAERARRSGRTKSALIREAVDAYLTPPAGGPDAALERMRAAVAEAEGSLPHLAPGAAYVDAVRADEARRLDERTARP